METAINKARKAEDEYVVSLYPDLQALQSDGIPQHRFLSEQARLRYELEKNDDSQLQALMTETIDYRKQLRWHILRRSKVLMRLLRSETPHDKL